MLQLTGSDPDLLKGQDPALVQAYNLARSNVLRPFNMEVTRNELNWLIAAGATSSWAVKIFPKLPAAEQEDQLWQAIFEACRIMQPDPLSAWQQHLQQLALWRAYLTEKQYSRRFHDWFRAVEYRRDHRRRPA